MLTSPVHNEVLRGFGRSKNGRTLEMQDSGIAIPNNNYIEKKLHTVYPMLYKPTLKNSKN